MFRRRWENRPKGYSMPGKKLSLVFGLGNPGSRYQNTRHNLGFMVVDQISADFQTAMNKTKFDAAYARARIDDTDVILAKPMTFMNKSGIPVSRFVGFYHVSTQDMLVIHDDIDLDFGRIKIKEKGGDGGHKGIRSIIDAIGKDDFCRLRIGIGRPEAGINAADYVLTPFNAAEREMLKHIIARARDAAVTILCNGAKEGMNRFNQMTITTLSQTTDGGK
jgi:peptidyl-tRNA hydrolase, PTH1 family